MASSAVSISTDEAIPKLTSSLGDDDDVVVATTLVHLNKFCKRKPFLNAVVVSKDLLSALVAELERSAKRLMQSDRTDEVWIISSSDLVYLIKVEESFFRGGQLFLVQIRVCRSRTEVNT